MKTLFHLLRVKQWIKNIFIFVPAFFGGELTLDNVPVLILAFVVFCMVSSSIYIVNDSQDKDEDKKHPTKKFRPIAAGIVSVSMAWIISIILLLAAFSIAYFFLNFNFIFVIALYYTINIFYSFNLKTVAIIDLLIVSLGFVFRIIAGAEVVAVEVSFWLLLMTFLFSIFIVIGKRRDDFREGPEQAVLLRPVNKHYNLYFLNYCIIIFSSLMMVCYIIYTYSSEYFQSSIYLALGSSVLVLIGLLRYLQAIFVENDGGNPTDFALKDVFIKIVLLLWLCIFCYLIYIK